MRTKLVAVAFGVACAMPAVAQQTPPNNAGGSPQRVEAAPHDHGFPWGLLGLLGLAGLMGMKRKEDVHTTRTGTNTRL